MTPFKVICQKVRPIGVSKYPLLGHHYPKRKSPKGSRDSIYGDMPKSPPYRGVKKLSFGASKLRNQESKYANKRRSRIPYYGVMMPKESLFDTPVGRTFWQSHPTPHLVSFFLSVFPHREPRSDGRAKTNRRKWRGNDKNGAPPRCADY